MDNIVQIKMSVDNAAFGVTYEDQATEVVRILRYLAQQIEASPNRLDGSEETVIRDLNGNRVGELTAYKE